MPCLKSCIFVLTTSAMLLCTDVHNSWGTVSLDSSGKFQ